MKDNSPWLFLEPYVHLLRQDDTLLVYNTVSKSVLEFALTNKLSDLANELIDPANGYVVAMTPDLIIDPAVQEFLNQLRSHFMGDLLDPSWSEGKPVNIIPEPVVKHGLHPKRREASGMQSGLDLRNYLQEMTLYLNNGPVSPSNPYRKAGLQFSYPQLHSDEKREMDIDLFRSLIDSVNQYTPTLIHLSGENLIAYPYLEQAIEQLSFSPFQKKYHLLIDHWEDQITPFILVQKNSSLALYIVFPTPAEAVGQHLERLPDQKLLKKIEFNFVVCNKEELDSALETIRILDLSNVYFKPCYTGKNLDFFRENVFISREEILTSQPDQKQVFSRNSINENDFGKLSVLPGGEVYANLNDPMIGNAATHSLVDMVSEELENGISWNRTRKSVAPCSGCIYQFLCPPVSSYEIFMQRFNFCDVYPNGGVS